MDDDIFHLGIVDGSLGVAAPSVECGGIIRKQADDVNRRQIEIETLRVLDAATEDQMESAHGAERLGRFAAARKTSPGSGLHETRRRLDFTACR
jgi:hypothetical protein